MSLVFPYNVNAVQAICTDLSADACKEGVIYLDSSWTDTPSLYMVSNDPEVGRPIRRLRSRNIKHTVPISFSISNYWYNKLWIPFIYGLHGGIDTFLFPEITYNKDAVSGLTEINEVLAWFDMSSGTPFSLKRQDQYTYTVSAKVCWNGEDVISAN